MKKEDLITAIQEGDQSLISKLGAALGVPDKKAIIELVRNDKKAFRLAMKVIGALPTAKPASTAEKLAF